MKGEYWHSGQLQLLDSTDMDGDKKEEILLAGINNGYRAATVVVLDPANLQGTSQQPLGDPFQIQGQPVAREKLRVFFRRTCINEKFEAYNGVRMLTVSGDSIKVSVWEKNGGNGYEVIYIFGRDLSLRDVIYSDPLKALHRELESRGELDHSLSTEEVNQLRNISIITTPTGT